MSKNDSVEERSFTSVPGLIDVAGSYDPFGVGASQLSGGVSEEIVVAAALTTSLMKNGDLSSVVPECIALLACRIVKDVHEVRNQVALDSGILTGSVEQMCASLRERRELTRQLAELDAQQASSGAVE